LRSGFFGSLCFGFFFLPNNRSPESFDAVCNYFVLGQA
jgi:hypothetical protein